jgi:hypothetical protein
LISEYSTLVEEDGHMAMTRQDLGTLLSTLCVLAAFRYVHECNREMSSWRKLEQAPIATQRGNETGGAATGRDNGQPVSPVRTGTGDGGSRVDVIAVVMNYTRPPEAFGNRSSDRTPPMVSSNTARHLGDRVRGLWRHGQVSFPGVIDQIVGGQYHIQYDDGDVEWTTAEYILDAQASFMPTPPSYAGQPAEAAVSLEGAVNPTGLCIQANTPLPVGTEVLARWQDTWWRASVLEVQSPDRIKVHYVGWDSQWDEVLPLSALQHADKKAKL